MESEKSKRTIPVGGEFVGGPVILSQEEKYLCPKDACREKGVYKKTLFAPCPSCGLEVAGIIIKKEI